MIRQVTLKGWVNDTGYLFSQNVRGFKRAKDQVAKLISENEGYKEKPEFGEPSDYRGSDKIRVYGWYWRGNWCDPEKKLFAILYKPKDYGQRKNDETVS